jgi:hypothetical protein
LVLEHERPLFPGGALVSLIARGDQEAAEVYARWIRVTLWLSTGFQSVFLSPTALRHPLVRPAAIEKALDTWRQFSEGEIKDGKRTTLGGGVMASVLGALRPAWEDSNPLMQKLIHLARNGDGADLTHAMAVFSRPPYPRELGDILVERFEKLADQAGNDHWGLVGFWINWAQRTSITMLARLVRANVSAWYQRWLEVMSSDSLPILGVFCLARILAPLLSPGQREELYRELRNRLGTLETYWIHEGNNPWDCIRLADLYARLLFEVGA